MGPVDGKFQAAAAQFDVGDRPVGGHGVPRTGVNHEQRKPAAPGERLKLLAGTGDPVYFMVNTREKRHPRISPVHETASGEISDGAGALTPPPYMRRNTRCTAALSRMRMQANVLST